MWPLFGCQGAVEYWVRDSNYRRGWHYNLAKVVGIRVVVVHLVLLDRQKQYPHCGWRQSPHPRGRRRDELTAELFGTVGQFTEGFLGTRSRDCTDRGFEVSVRSRGEAGRSGPPQWWAR
jgi:hypothetical protein